MKKIKPLTCLFFLIFLAITSHNKTFSSDLNNRNYIHYPPDFIYEINDQKMKLWIADETLKEWSNLTTEERAKYHHHSGNFAIHKAEAKQSDECYTIQSMNANKNIKIEQDGGRLEQCQTLTIKAKNPQGGVHNFDVKNLAVYIIPTEVSYNENTKTKRYTFEKAEKTIKQEIPPQFFHKKLGIPLWIPERAFFAWENLSPEKKVRLYRNDPINFYMKSAGALTFNEECESEQSCHSYLTLESKTGLMTELPISDITLNPERRNTELIGDIRDNIPEAFKSALEKNNKNLGLDTTEEAQQLLPTTQARVPNATASNSSGNTPTGPANQGTAGSPRAENTSVLTDNGNNEDLGICSLKEEEPETPTEDGEEPTSQTEAADTCTFCEEFQRAFAKEQADLDVIQDFLSQVKTRTNQYKQAKGDQAFETMIKNFCETCAGADIDNFIQYIEKRSQEEQVPSEIIMALMLRESGGMCNVKNRTDESFGLFQLNLNFKAEFKVARICNNSELTMNMNDKGLREVCEKGYENKTRCIKNRANQWNHDQCRVYGKNNRRPGACLNNPYCNFEESLRLLKQKYRITNKDRKLEKITGRPWHKISRNDRDRWRNAIIAYNTNTFNKAVTHFLNDNLNIKDIQDVSGIRGFSGWEAKRMFLLTAMLNKKAEAGNSATKYHDFFRENPKGKRLLEQMISNLAFLERITGRENQDPGQSSICEWKRFKQKNTIKSCDQSEVDQESTNESETKDSSPSTELQSPNNPPSPNQPSRSRGRTPPPGLTHI